MSSSLNPPVSDKKLPDAPAEETIPPASALVNPEQNINSQITSTPPSHDLPGAFPVSESDGSESSSAPVVVETAMDTARSYLRKGVNTLENYLGTQHKSTVSASPNDTTHQPSNPTQETLGARVGEHVGGVGSLPGTNFEAGVAKLPDERSAEAGETSHTIPGNIATAKEDVGQAIVTSSTTNDHTSFSGGPGQKNHTFSLPSQETEGAQPGEHVGGVGSLPGKLDESRVVLLPDERNEVSRDSASCGPVENAKEDANQFKPVQNISEKQTSSQTQELSGQQSGEFTVPSVGSRANTTDVAGGTIKDKSNEKNGQQQPVAQLKPRIYPLGGEGAQLNGVDLSRSGVLSWEQNFAKVLPPKPEDDFAESEENQDSKLPGEEEYHPAADQKYSQGSTKVSNDRKSESSVPRPRSSVNGNSNGVCTKKVGFKEKVAGRSKILMGKLANNPEKIEAGRKIINGEA